MEAFVVCQLCGDAIGVYEPVAVVGSESTRVTSLAREPGLSSRDVILAHKGCLPGQPDARRNGD